jgi:hypothetical protein
MHSGRKRKNMCGTRTESNKEKLGRGFTELYNALTGMEIYKDTSD